MELICPSCEARYQVPEASIGDSGRQVSCMNCGHSWHAFPPLTPGSTPAPPATPAQSAAWHGSERQTPPGPDRSSAAFAPAEAGRHAPSPRAAPGTSAPSRSEQLAEIREMLAEVQAEKRAAAQGQDDDGSDVRAAGLPRSQEADPAPDPPEAVSGPEPTRAPSAEPQHGRDPIVPDEPGDEDAGPYPLRPVPMQEAEDRRRTEVERLRTLRESSAPSGRAREVGLGAFLTGFLLIVMIAAIMTAIYMLHPQIEARMPGTGPALAEYVETVDGIRVRVDEGYRSARDWVVELIGEDA